MNLRTLRECSDVERCHCVSHQGSYSVGKHSYDAVMLCLHLWPDSSRNLIIAILTHDLPERWLGDVPATAKWDYPKLAEAYREAEQSVIEREGIPQPELSPLEQHRLNLVDRLELWLWCQEQLGTPQIDMVQQRLQFYFDGLEAEGRLPEEVRRILCT